MSVKIFDAADLSQATISPADTVVFGEGTLRLKHRNSAGAFDREGGYVQGTAILPNFYAEGIKELTNFAASKFDELTDGTDLGDIEYQLSNDGGTTFYYWAGSIWAAAGASDWNTEVEVDENISTFPLLNPRQIQIKVRLTPPDSAGPFSGSGTLTPVLADVAVAFDSQGDVLEDLAISLQSYIQSTMECRFVQETDIQFATDEAVVDVYQNFAGVTAGSVRVYNLTTDPTESTDLFSSIAEDAGAETGTITMSSSQASGSIIKVYFSMKPLVFIAPPDFLASADMDGDDVASRTAFPVAKLPSIALIPLRIVPDSPVGNLLDGPAVRSKLRSSPEERSFRHHRLFTANCLVKLLAPLGADAWRMASSGKRIAEIDNEFPSLQYGHPYDILGFTLQERSQIAQNLIVLDYTMVVRGRDGDEQGTSTKLAIEINAQLGSFTENYGDPVQVVP